VARCIRVIDQGTTYNERWDKLQRKVMVTFELPNAIIEDEGELKGQPHAISNFYTFSMNEKANMRTDLESWRGRKFTDSEAEKFDILNLLDVPAYVNVIHNDKDGKTYANIASIMPLPDGIECPAAINEVYSFSLEREDYTPEALNKLSEKMQDRIKQSREWQALNAGVADEPQGQPQDDGFDPNSEIPF